ncbi:MAG: hypothetical protein DLM59_06675 [Pseudonocardiales bacterium]|nr:MAG: hypothetical protein DLM59_06675 [Pseudonocardiales bacterium]
MIAVPRGTFDVKVTRTRPPVVVSADGDGVVSHAGSRLLADLAERTTLTAQLSAVFAGRVASRTAHDPGRVLSDVAVMIAGGGECISDIATLADRPGVFGPVASDSKKFAPTDNPESVVRLIDATPSAEDEAVADSVFKDLQGRLVRDMPEAERETLVVQLCLEADGAGRRAGRKSTDGEALAEELTRRLRARTGRTDVEVTVGAAYTRLSRIRQRVQDRMVAAQLAGKGRGTCQTLDGLVTRLRRPAAGQGL